MSPMEGSFWSGIDEGWWLLELMNERVGEREFSVFRERESETERMKMKQRDED